MMIRYILTFFLLLLSGSPIIANDAQIDKKFPFPGEIEQVHANHDAPSYHSEPDQFQDKFFRMLYLLALLIGLMVASSWFLKKIMHKRAESLNISGNIKVLESRALSSKSTIYLLDVNGKGLLVAESHSGVHPLGEVSLEDEVK